MSGIQWKGTPPDKLFLQKFHEGLIAMIADVDAKAKANAPVVTGALKNSGRFRSQGDMVIEQFGNSRVQYAALRERGPNRKASTEHYLERAAQDVSKGNIAQYFK